MMGCWPSPVMDFYPTKLMLSSSMKLSAVCVSSSQFSRSSGRVSLLLHCLRLSHHHQHDSVCLHSQRPQQHRGPGPPPRQRGAAPGIRDDSLSGEPRGPDRGGQSPDSGSPGSGQRDTAGSWRKQRLSECQR